MTALGLRDICWPGERHMMRHLIPIAVVTLGMVFFFQNCSSEFKTKTSESQQQNGSPLGGDPPGSTPPTGGPPGGSGSGGGGSGGAGGCATSSGVAKNFSCNQYFNQEVGQIALTPAQKNYSDHLINGLAARGGWGNSNIFQVDTSIDVLTVTAGNAAQFTLNPNDPNWLLPDSDIPSTMPAPPAGSALGFESSEGRSCDDGDCHYLVLDPVSRQLFEVYRAHANGSTLSTAGDGSIAIWPFAKTWTASLRGDVCTSADAGGLSIGALLFNADEIKAGSINHAIRLILPNPRIACRTYVRPATHTTGPSNCAGWAPAPTTDLSEAPQANGNDEPGIPYGSRLRLKASYNLSGLSASAQVVARALQKYGMILADGGQIALTAQSDAGTQAKYSELGFSARSLSALQVTDFEVVPPPAANVDLQAEFQPTVVGNMIKVRFLDCVRNP